jgi:hypothetical protein
MSSNDAVVVLQYKKGNLPYYRTRYIHAFENIINSTFYAKEAFEDETPWPMFSLAKYDAEEKFHYSIIENGFEPEYGIVLIKKYKDMTWEQIEEKAEKEFAQMVSEQPKIT